MYMYEQTGSLLDPCHCQRRLHIRSSSSSPANKKMLKKRFNNLLKPKSEVSHRTTLWHTHHTQIHTICPGKKIH